MRSMLEGVRVVDFTNSVAGPFCTYYLGDMGAEVIKVEGPGGGEDARFFPPIVEGVSGSFVQLNRSKKGVVFDLKTAKGVELFKELVGASDVLVENYTPGTMARFGVDYENLKSLNPRLVMCSISGYGQYGPLSPLPGYDSVIQAMSGLMSTTGMPDGPPLKSGSIIVDIATALFAAYGICAALYRRERDGQGEYIDVAMFDVALNLLEVKFVEYALTGQAPGRFGNRYPYVTPFDTFPTRDEYVLICCAGDNTFRNLTKAMGRPELADDDRFSGNIDRNSNEPALKELIEDWTRERTSAEVLETLLASGVPVATVCSVKEAIENPHTAARGMVVDIEQPGAGVFKSPGSAIKAANSTIRPRCHAPGYGEHNEWLLRGVLGKDEGEISRILQGGAMGAPPRR